MLHTRPLRYAAAFGVVLLNLALGSNAHAQATTASDTAANVAPADADSSSKLSLGLGAGIARSPYRDYGNKTSALPLLIYDSKYFHFAGTGADFKLGSYQQFDFTLRAKYSNDGYQSSDAAILNDMHERKDAIWLGGTAVWHAPWAKLTAEWLKDASGYSQGQTFKLNAERGFRLGRVLLTPHLGVAWYDKNDVDYYYGVRQDEATASRSAYTGKSTINTSIGLRTGLRLTTTQSLFLDATATHLGSGITDSPLVDHATVPSLRMGYLYQF